MKSTKKVFVKKGYHSRLCRPQDSGIFDDCSYTREQQTTCVEDPRTLRLATPSGMAKYVARGFTLIELLVVVLIIGILAAVALPQYQKAVEKNRAVQALTVLRATTQAVRVYYLAHGTYPTKFEQLDINIPWVGNKKWKTVDIIDTISSQDWSLQLGKTPGRNYFDIYIGRISGPYQGAGFMTASTGFAALSGEQDRIVCVERFSNGITYSKTAGSYCESLFHGNYFASSATYRGYTLP